MYTNLASSNMFSLMLFLSISLTVTGLENMKQVKYINDSPFNVSSDGYLRTVKCETLLQYALACLALSACAVVDLKSGGLYKSGSGIKGRIQLERFLELPETTSPIIQEDLNHLALQTIQRNLDDSATQTIVFVEQMGKTRPIHVGTFSAGDSSAVKTDINVEGRVFSVLYHRPHHTIYWSCRFGIQGQLLEAGSEHFSLSKTPARHMVIHQERLYYTDSHKIYRQSLDLKKKVKILHNTVKSSTIEALDHDNDILFWTRRKQGQHDVIFATLPLRISQVLSYIKDTHMVGLSVDTFEDVRMFVWISKKERPHVHVTIKGRGIDKYTSRCSANHLVTEKVTLHSVQVYQSHYFMSLGQGSMSIARKKLNKKCEADNEVVLKYKSASTSPAVFTFV